jgi:hypothetical protein
MIEHMEQESPEEERTPDPEREHQMAKMAHRNRRR